MSSDDGARRHEKDEEHWALGACPRAVSCDQGKDPGAAHGNPVREVSRLCYRLSGFGS